MENRATRRKLAATPDRSASAVRSGIARNPVAMLASVDAGIREGTMRDLVPIPTGFPVLDGCLGGGVRPGDLLVLGGAPGSGKTILGMQWARSFAASGAPTLVASYEHEEAQLLGRLLALELGGSTPPPSTLFMERFWTALRGVAVEGGSLASLIAGDPTLAVAWERLQTEARDLSFAAVSSPHVGVEELGKLAEQSGSTALVVDYLQKLAVDPPEAEEAERITNAVEALKTLALEARLAIVAIVAAGQEGLRAPRMRMHHIRGAGAISYEADVAIMLSEKSRAVSKVHLQYDQVRAATFADWIVLSIEKNRLGPSPVDLEFHKNFTHFRFDPNGGVVTDRLVDGVFEEE